MAVSVRLARSAPAKTVHPLEGFGAQLNTDLFTTAGQPNGVTEAQLAELGAAIDNLSPGHSRIFVQRGLRPETEKGRDAPEFKALMSTIQLAQSAKANVNLTWWGQGPYGNEAKLRALAWPNRSIRNWPQAGRRKWPPELTDPEHPQALSAPRIMMQRFALVIAEAHRRKFTCVTHATIQNEPNGAGCDIAKQKDPGLSMRFYELLYRHFDAALRAIPDPNAPSRTLREAVRIVGGDLLERKTAPATHQDAWLRYMHANMAVPRPGLDPVVDGYSVHVYWEPGDGDEGFPTKLESRLEHLEQTIRNLPSKLPVYVTEFGVRKLNAKPRPGKLNGTRMEASAEAAFQHAWFKALAPQYGVAGIVKWALYRTDVNKGWGDWGMIDSPKAGLERFPATASRASSTSSPARAGRRRASVARATCSHAGSPRRATPRSPSSY
jgi:hypothetical protein